MEFFGDCFFGSSCFNIVMKAAGKKGTRLTKFGRHLLISRRAKSWTLRARWPWKYSNRNR